MAVDSNMIHICIYIFTINHLSRYIIKKKKKKKSLQTFKCINYWMALTLRFCATIITKHFFFFSPGVLKRVDGREKSMRNTFNILVLSSLQAATSYRKSTEEQVPSSCWFWLCWYVDGFFFSFQEIVKFHRDLRAPCRQEDKKIWGPRLLDRQQVTDQCPSFPPLISFFLKVFFSLRRFFFCFFFIPVGTEWFHPHRLSVTKDWPEYKNIISFLKRRTQTWFNGKKNNPSMFRESLG